MDRLVINTKDKPILFILEINGIKYNIHSLSVEQLKEILKYADLLDAGKVTLMEGFDYLIKIIGIAVCKDGVPAEILEDLDQDQANEIVFKIMQSITGSSSMEKKQD